MNVFQEAKDWFEGKGEDFTAALLHCLISGWVIRRRDFFLLASEVLAYPEKGVVSVAPEDPKNCWFLWYLGHDRGVYTPYDYMAEAPYPHRFVAYKRRGKILVREWDKLRRDYNIRTSKMEIDKYGRKSFSPSACAT